MTTTQPNTLGDLLLFELSVNWSRETVTLTGGNYVMGTVLARVSGKYLPIDPAGTGAAKVARAVLAQAVNASSADKKGVVIARGASLASELLVWPAGTTDPQKAAALDDLDARGIVVRATP